MAEDRESPLSRWSRLKQSRKAAASGDRRGRGRAMPVAFDEPHTALPSVPGNEERPESTDSADSPQEVASRPDGVGAEQAPPAADQPPADQPPADQPPADQPPADQPPADQPPVDLPPVESLTKDSDFKAFLADGVPEELKRAALRKLWRSDPIFSIIDGLDDYDEDFRIVHKMLATADELRKGWAGADKQGEAEEPGEGEDWDDEGDEEIAVAEGDEENADAEGDEEIAGADSDEENAVAEGDEENAVAEGDEEIAGADSDEDTAGGTAEPSHPEKEQE